MIKNIIFDFGDVFLNLDKEAPFKAFQTFYHSKKYRNVFT